MEFENHNWPMDAERIQRYQLYQNLYDGEHAKAFEKSLSKPIKDAGGDGLTWLEFDYPRIIVDVSTNLLVSETPVVSYSDTKLNEVLRGIMDRSHFPSVLLEVAQAAAIHGDAVMVARMTGKGVIIEPKPAYTYFPELSPDNCREVISEQLVWERWFQDEKVLRVDRYREGQIFREAYALEAMKIRRRIVGSELMALLQGEDEIVQTGVPDRNTLVHVPNQRKVSDFFGRSDLGGGLPSLFEEINWRASKISVILDKHSDPKLFGPKIPRPPGSDPSRPIDASELSYIETKDGSAPAYLIWDAQLVQATEQYKRLETEILRQSETAAVLAGKIEGARFDSARAYKIQLSATLAKNSRKRLNLDPAVKEALRVGVAMELGVPYSEIPDPSVKWRDGLPKDRAEDSQTENNRIASKTSSRLSAIRRLDDCDEQTALDELERINTEQQNFGGVEMPPQTIENEAPVDEVPPASEDTP